MNNPLIDHRFVQLLRDARTQPPRVFTCLECAGAPERPFTVVERCER